MAELTPENEAVLVELVSTGRKIEAIKLLRERAGLGLKDQIDALEASINRSVAGKVAAPEKIDSLRTGAAMLPQEKLAALSDLVFQERKVEAIKCYREWTRVDLKEAKDQIAALEAALRMKAPEKFASPQRKGCLIGILGLCSLSIIYWIAHA